MIQSRLFLFLNAFDLWEFEILLFFAVGNSSLKKGCAATLALLVDRCVSPLRIVQTTAVQVLALS